MLWAWWCGGLVRPSLRLLPCWVAWARHVRRRGLSSTERVLRDEHACAAAEGRVACSLAHEPQGIHQRCRLYAAGRADHGALLRARARALAEAAAAAEHARDAAALAADGAAEALAAAQGDGPPPDKVVFRASGDDVGSGRRPHVACLYHLLSKAVTPDGAKQGQFMQVIYTLDDQAATARRGTVRRGAELDVVELPRLTRMMSERTPYVQQFNASRRYT